MGVEQEAWLASVRVSESTGLRTLNILERQLSARLIVHLRGNEKGRREVYIVYQMCGVTYMYAWSKTYEV